jgi:hypothetical protein
VPRGDRADGRPGPLKITSSFNESAPACGCGSDESPPLAVVESLCSPHGILPRSRGVGQIGIVGIYTVVHLYNVLSLLLRDRAQAGEDLPEELKEKQQKAARDDAPVGGTQGDEA